MDLDIDPLIDAVTYPNIYFNSILKLLNDALKIKTTKEYKIK